MITIHNVETGEITQRELNAEELAQRAKDEAAQEAALLALSEAAAKRQALLAKLGITEDEARLLLG